MDFLNLSRASETSSGIFGERLLNNKLFCSCLERDLFSVYNQLLISSYFSDLMNAKLFNFKKFFLKVYASPLVKISYNNARAYLKFSSLILSSNFGYLIYY